VTISSDAVFADFLSRVRAGDEEAAAELVRRYAPIIRREVRMRLTDPRLHRQFDSADVCQSVLLSFFVRAAVGQYDLRHPGDLRNLLVAMARNKLASRSRQLLRQSGNPSDGPAGSPPPLEAVADPHPSAEQILSGRDLLGQVLRRLPPEERRLAELRGQGRTWPEVSAELGGTPEARRKQLGRALDRVLQQLGLDADW
jgi:RNA polymerase sigma-70 factor (ECF subfamily)